MSQDISTRLIHHGYVPPAGYQAVSPGVFKGSTVLFPNAATVRERAKAFGHRDGFSYGLYGTPTTYTLEQRLCTLEGGRHCLLCPSGQAEPLDVCSRPCRAADRSTCRTEHP